MCPLVRESLTLQLGQGLSGKRLLPPPFTLPAQARPSQCLLGHTALWAEVWGDVCSWESSIQQTALQACSSQDCTLRHDSASSQALEDLK